MHILDEAGTLGDYLADAKAKPKRKAGPEGLVLKSCLDCLAKLGIWAWRNNTGAGEIRGRWMRFSQKGSPDIFGMLPGGRWLAVEVKAGSNKASAAQEAWLSRARSLGAVCGVVRNVAELKTLLVEGGFCEF